MPGHTRVVPSAADCVATLFKTSALCAEYLRLYDSLLSKWPAETEAIDVETSFGSTHLNVVGPKRSPALFLLPGFGANSTMWFANIGSLGKHFRVYAIDTIGQPGRSVPSRRLTALTTSEWLLGLMDKLSIKKADFAGVSLGGWITLDFAIRNPDRVNRIALLDPAASFAPMRVVWILHSILPIMIFPTRNGLIRYFRWLTRGRAVNAQWGELMVQGILNCKAQPPVRASPFTDAQLADCTAPTLVLAGAQSVIYDPKKAVARATRYMPYAKTEIIANASHGLIYEQADQVNSDIITFLEAGK